MAVLSSSTVLILEIDMADTQTGTTVTISQSSGEVDASGGLIGSAALIIRRWNGKKWGVHRACSTGVGVRGGVRFKKLRFQWQI
jgi:hypothetical protein